MTRGDVVRLPATHRADGHEQQGVRYAVVLQADELSLLSTVIVAPTSRGARAASFRPEVEVAGATTKVMVEQLRAVDGRRLGETAGHLHADELWDVEKALILVLDLLSPVSRSGQ